MRYLRITYGRDEEMKGLLGVTINLIAGRSAQCFGLCYCCSGGPKIRLEAPKASIEFSQSPGD
jgi:hypothetical protein